MQHLSLAQGHTSGHGMDGAAFDRSRGTPELQRANTPMGQTSSLPDLKGNSSHPGGPGTHHANMPLQRTLVYLNFNAT